MKTSRSLLFFTVLLAGATSLVAQQRTQPRSLFETLLNRSLLRPLGNSSMTQTITTPQGPVTIARTSLFDGTTGSFSATLTLPNNNTGSLSGSVTKSDTGIIITGSFTPPNSTQSGSFDISTQRTDNGFTSTKTITTPNGNTITQAVDLTRTADEISSTVTTTRNGQTTTRTQTIKRGEPPRG